MVAAHFYFFFLKTLKQAESKKSGQINNYSSNCEEHAAFFPRTTRDWLLLRNFLPGDVICECCAKKGRFSFKIFYLIRHCCLHKSFFVVVVPFTVMICHPWYSLVMNWIVNQRKHLPLGIGKRPYEWVCGLVSVWVCNSASVYFKKGGQTGSELIPKGLGHATPQNCHKRLAARSWSNHNGVCFCVSRVSRP